MKKTTFWTSVIILNLFGSFLFFWGLENSFDTTLSSGLRENFMLVSIFGFIVTTFGLMSGLLADKRHLI